MSFSSTSSLKSVSVPTQPQVPGEPQANATIELPPLPKTPSMARAQQQHAVTAQQGPNRSVARTLMAPFRAVRNAFLELRNLIAENQSLRRQAHLTKRLDAAATKFGEVFKSKVATPAEKFEACLALMQVAGKLHPSKPEESAVAAIHNLEEMTPSSLTSLSMSFFSTAKARLVAADMPLEAAAKNLKSELCQSNAFILAFRAKFGTVVEPKKGEAETKVLAAANATVGKTSQARALDVIERELEAHFSDESTNEGNVLRGNDGAAMSMKEFLDAQDSPEYRHHLNERLLQASTITIPLPLDERSAGPTLETQLLTVDQMTVILNSAKELFKEVTGDGTHASAQKAASRLSPPAVQLLQKVDEKMKQQLKFADDSAARRSAFSSTLFLRHLNPAMTMVRVNSVSNPLLQQESAVASFIAAFIQSTANQGSGASLQKLTAGLSEECSKMVLQAMAECSQPLEAFKQAVMERTVEA